MPRPALLTCTERVDVRRSGKSRPALAHLYIFVVEKKKCSLLLQMSDNSEEKWENKPRFSKNCEFLVLNKKYEGKVCIVFYCWFLRALVCRVLLSKWSYNITLIDWVGGSNGKIFGSHAWCTDLAAFGLYVMTSSLICSRQALPLSQ